MLTIYCDKEGQEKVNQILSSVEELTGLYRLLSTTKKSFAPKNPYLKAEKDLIQWPIDWHNSEPPILFRPQVLNEQNLLCMVFAKIGHYDLALRYQSDPTLFSTVQQLASLIQGQEHLSLSSGEEFFERHNAAIIQHYTNIRLNGDSLTSYYQGAIDHAPDTEYEVFSAKHYATYLSDMGEILEAKNLLTSILAKTISKEAEISIKFDLIDILMAQLTIPYDTKLVGQLKELISECLDYYESTSLEVRIAMLLVQASEIANIDGSYAESMKYINRAITIYESEQISEFLAQAFLRKGTLLYTWAQNGNPQFYKGAIETYQEALKTFKKETFPSVFAEIHHNLGVIYAEAPAEDKQRSMWAAVSATSFKESLECYTKEDHPYAYAMVCNNYANALVKYPPAKNSDNVEKAIHLYHEALEIRTADNYPLERAHTLLNYLEACWRVNNVNETMERVRCNDMELKAREVKELTIDQNLHEQAEEHLDKLKDLRKVLILS